MGVGGDGDGELQLVYDHKENRKMVSKWEKKKQNGTKHGWETFNWSLSHHVTPPLWQCRRLPTASHYDTLNRACLFAPGGNDPFRQSGYSYKHWITGLEHDYLTHHLSLKKREITSFFTKNNQKKIPPTCVLSRQWPT